jgi:hypothetical protein
VREALTGPFASSAFLPDIRAALPEYLQCFNRAGFLKKKRDFFQPVADFFPESGGGLVGQDFNAKPAVMIVPNRHASDSRLLHEPFFMIIFGGD